MLHVVASSFRDVSAAKLVIISNNIQPVRKSELEYYAMLAKTGVHHYSGSESFSNGQPEITAASKFA